MKKVMLISAMIFGAALLLGSPSALTYTCLDGTTNFGTCAPSRVSFSGTGYPAAVHVSVVRNSDQASYDDFDYDATTGTLAFTETLYPSGTYTVTVSYSTGSSSVTVTTGAPTWRHDDD
jgi:hypothetical protein